MASGLTPINVTDAGGVERTVQFFSTTAAATGSLSSTTALVDAAGAQVVPANAGVQSTMNTSLTSILNSVSTAALQSTTNASLVTIAANIAKGALDSTGLGQTYYASPDGRGVVAVTNLAGAPFSDDFGGTAIDLTKWDVIPGGLGANPTGLGLTATTVGGALTQAAIGTGTVGSITAAVASSSVTITMGTTSGSEYWMLSRRLFAASENIVVNLYKSQAIAANDFFVGLVEVDVATGVPLLNPNLAGYFTNMGGCNFGITTSTTTVTNQAIGDKSNVIATGAQAALGSATTTSTNEYEIEIAAEDVITSQGTTDSALAKGVNIARVSTQCPNDAKTYKLLIRARNVSAPASTTTFVIGRILCECKQGMRVTVDSGNGDQTPQKALAVNVSNTTFALPSSATVAAANSLNTNAIQWLYNLTSNVYSPARDAASSVTTGAFLPGAALVPHYGAGAPMISSKTFPNAATTNPTLVKATQGRLYNGVVYNATTSVRYMKFYNKATAPVPGTDVPVITIPLVPGQNILHDMLGGVYGYLFASGFGYAITQLTADADTTACAAGDITLCQLFYV